VGVEGALRLLQVDPRNPAGRGGSPARRGSLPSDQIIQRPGTVRKSGVMMPVLQSRVRSGPEFERNRSGYRDLVETLRERHRRVLEGGGEKLRRRHRERGKIPVRERIDYLIDPLSPFLELSP